MTGEWIFRILNMSLTGSVVLLLVLILRIPMKRGPRKYVCFLWLIGLIRLLMPISVPSPFSLLPVNGEPLRQVTVEGVGRLPYLNLGIHSVDGSANLLFWQTMKPEQLASADPVQIWTYVGAWLWMTGAFLFVAVNLIRYGRLRIRLRDAVPETLSMRSGLHSSEGGTERTVRVYRSARISMPMVVGFLFPRIYLPASLFEEEASREREFAVIHEETHIRRKDHWMKLVGFAALAVHWFHPLVWLCFACFCRDLEMACDEAVMETLGEERKKEYSMALLHFAERQSGLLIPLAFGESHTKSRIRNILKYKKPMVWVSGAALMAVFAAAVCLLTSPEDSKVMAGEVIYGTEDSQGNSISIIGGADGPTSIFVAGKLGEENGEQGAFSSEVFMAEKVDLQALGNQPYGAGVELDYVSAGEISLHGSFGYLVFELGESAHGAEENGKAEFLDGVTLTEAGGIAMQGDSYTEIVGSKGGAYIIPDFYNPDVSVWSVYEYDIASGILTELFPVGPDSAITFESLGLRDAAGRPTTADAYLDDSAYDELAETVRSRTQSQVLYGPVGVLEYDSVVYGFLATKGDKVSDIWYGMWWRHLGQLRAMILFP